MAYKRSVALLVLLALTGCGQGSGGSASGGSHTVALSWTASHDTGVNEAGGGYLVTVPGQSPIRVPWTSGALAPTSVQVTLASGLQSLQIQSYAALDVHGGNSGSVSAPTTIQVNVP